MKTLEVPKRINLTIDEDFANMLRYLKSKYPLLGYTELIRMAISGYYTQSFELNNEKKFQKSQKFNKLVRDNIPEIIKKKGEEIAKIHIADEKEYWHKLKEKLLEEAYEVLEDENIEEELADVLEVIDSICAFQGIEKEKLDILKQKKFEERGGFSKKIILENSEKK